MLVYRSVYVRLKNINIKKKVHKPFIPKQQDIKSKPVTVRLILFFKKKKNLRRPVQLVAVWLGDFKRSFLVLFFSVGGKGLIGQFFNQFFKFVFVL